MITWLNINYKWLVPFLILVATNLANGLIKHPRIQNVLNRLVDVLSVVVHSDSPGTFKLPLVQLSKPPINCGILPMPSDTEKTIPIILIPLVVFFMASCACWSAAHRNDQACVVLNQIINCTEDAAISNLAPVISGIINKYIAGQSGLDWGAIEADLEGAGIKDGGCILAQLQHDFLSAKKMTLAEAPVINKSLSAFKAHFGRPDVRFCFHPHGSSAQICQ